MKVFGEGFQHDDLEHIPTPVGQTCLHCEEPIAEGDCGFETPYLGAAKATTAVQHRECFLRGIFGSVGHQRKTCSCYGGAEEDPPGLSRREAAKAAVEQMMAKH